MPLLDTTIRTAKPKDKLYRLIDANGLCLEVTPTGSKLWRYRYRFNGSAKMLAICADPSVTLLKARQRRDEARQMLIDGIDPGEQKKAAKQAQRVEGLTFEKLAREWFAYNTPRWADSTTYKAKLYLENDLTPDIGARPVKAITRPELVEPVRKVEARGTLNAIGKIRQWLHQIFRYGLAKGVVDTNPATDLSVVAAPPKAARHHPHVTFAELPELVAKIEAANIHTLTRHAIRLLALTASRPSELRQAPWTEFDLDAALWTIPAERMKARRPHIVPHPARPLRSCASSKKSLGAMSLFCWHQSSAPHERKHREQGASSHGLRRTSDRPWLPPYAEYLTGWPRAQQELDRAPACPRRQRRDTRHLQPRSLCRAAPGNDASLGQLN